MPSKLNTLLGSPHLSLALSLFFVLSSLYFLTYNGRSISTDENRLFDMTESFARNGNVRETIFFDLSPLQADPEKPLAPYKEQYEPLHPILASGLFAIAQRVPDWGLVYTVWLFNIFVTALAAVAVYFMGINQGYSAKVAWLGGLLFGTGTFAWVYARTFFREPLAMLFIALVVLSALVVRREFQQDHLHIRRLSLKLGILLVMLLLGALAKEIVIVGLAFIAILLIPYTPQQRKYLLVAMVGGVFLIGVIWFIFGDVLGGSDDSKRYSLAYWFKAITEFSDIERLALSTYGYSLSPTRGFFWYSPVLLLALVGMGILYKRGDWRLVLAIIVMFFIFATGYGAIRPKQWWGGNGWGPRYLLLLVPVFMPALFPILESILNKSTQLVWRVLAFGVIGISVGLQLLSFTIPNTLYYSHLSAIGVPVGEGKWGWEQSVFNVYPQLLDWQQPDMRFFNVAQGWLVVGLCIVLIGGQVWWMRRAKKQSSPLFTAIFYGLSSMTLIASMGIGMYLLREAPPNNQNYDQLWVMVDQLNERVSKQDVVVLETIKFQNTVMNRYKGPAPLYTLPVAPGERYTQDYVPTVISDDTAELAGPYITALFTRFADNNRQFVWLLTELGPYQSFALRPAERYLAENYFLVETIVLSDTMRTVRFAMLPAPASSTTPTNVTTFTYNEKLRLAGFDLVTGTTYHASEILAVSLLWEPLETLAFDYNVAVHILDSNGQLVAQQDGQPQGNFGRISQWAVGATYRDHHGIELPADLPAGTYQLNVLVYDWRDGSRLATTDGEQSGEWATIAEITVE